MKKTNFFKGMLLPMLLCLIPSCDKDNDGPNVPDTPGNLSESIHGQWLLSTANPSEWSLFDFKSSSAFSLEWFINNEVISSQGAYFLNEEKKSVTGRLQQPDGREKVIDWIVTGIKAYELSLDIYGGQDGNQFIGKGALYKYLGATDIESNSSLKPDYKRYSGTSECTDFYSVNARIATVDPASGEVKGISAGTTFIVFTTPAGHAAIRINVTESDLPFDEWILGTWVTDNLGEVWERDTYGKDGYFFAEWSREIIYPTSGETATGTYKIDTDKKIISASAKTPYNQRINVEYHIVTDTKYDFYSHIYSGGDKTAEYYYQRLLASFSMKPGESITPQYNSYVNNSEIVSYKIHDSKIAEVDPTTGMVTAKSNGITYVDVKTPSGTGVVEINVKGGPIPVAFEDCIGKNADKVHEIIGNKPYAEDNACIVYKNYTPEIDMIGVDLDELTGTVKGILINYNSSVNSSQVTSILDAAFIPYKSQTTSTFKAYMNAANREDASVGVTWDIPNLTLTYVNLATDLFPDYSVLIGKTKTQVLDKMGRDPDNTNEESQSWFFFDNKGIAIVSAYYTDFVTTFDKVQSVVTMLDDTLTVEQVTEFLKKKYPYYPEHSTEKELVFIPAGHKMEIFYQPESKLIMYISTSSSSKSKSHPRSMVNLLKMNVKSIKR